MVAWAALFSSKTTTLAKTADLELIRLVLPAGKEIPTLNARNYSDGSNLPGD